MNKDQEEELLLIKAFLEHKLDVYKALQVEKRIKEDSEFAKKVTDYQNIIKGVEAFGQTGFKEQETWEEEITPASGNSWWPLAAGAIVVAIILGVWLFPGNKVIDHQAIFAMHFEPYKDLISMRDVSESALISEGFRDYNKAYYQNAVKSFTAYLRDVPDRTIRFYLAQSYLGNNQEIEAKSILQELAKDENFLFHEAAQWYYALALIKNNELLNAKRVLDSFVSDPDHDYQPQAVELIEHLEQSLAN